MSPHSQYFSEVNTLLDILKTIKAQYYFCAHCAKKSCSYKCNYCIEQKNEIVWLYGFSPQSRKSVNTPIGAEYCHSCEVIEKLCMLCVFVCAECHDYFCIKNHLQYVCGKCDGKFCGRDEDDSIICKICNIKCCWKCQWKYQENAKHWNKEGDLYPHNVCTECYEKSHH